MAFRVPRPLGFALRLLAVVLASFLLLEGSVRFLFFSDAAASWGIARRLRDPARSGHPECDDLYWVLTALWKGAEKRRRPVPYEPLVGWTSTCVEARSWW